MQITESVIHFPDLYDHNNNKNTIADPHYLNVEN